MRFPGIGKVGNCTVSEMAIRFTHTHTHIHSFIQNKVWEVKANPCKMLCLLFVDDFERKERMNEGEKEKERNEGRKEKEKHILKS